MIKWVSLKQALLESVVEPPTYPGDYDEPDWDSITHELRFDAVLSLQKTEYTQAQAETKATELAEKRDLVIVDGVECMRHWSFRCIKK